MTHTISLYYFPAGFRYVTPAFIVSALVLIYSGYVATGIIIVLVSIFILSARYVTVIDVSKREITDAFSAFMINFNSEKEKFDQMNRIVITKGTYAQNVHTRFSSRSFQWSDYSATLIYNGNQTLDLVTRTDKQDVINFVKLYSQTLNVPVEDLSRPASSSRPSYR